MKSHASWPSLLFLATPALILALCSEFLLWQWTCGAMSMQILTMLPGSTSKSSPECLLIDVPGIVQHVLKLCLELLLTFCFTQVLACTPTQAVNAKRAVSHEARGWPDCFQPSKNWYRTPLACTAMYIGPGLSRWHQKAFMACIDCKHKTHVG